MKYAETEKLIIISNKSHIKQMNKYMYQITHKKPQCLTQQEEQK